jgi:hypothetical protein
MLRQHIQNVEPVYGMLRCKNKKFIITHRISFCSINSNIYMVQTDLKLDMWFKRRGYEGGGLASPNSLLILNSFLQKFTLDNHFQLESALKELAPIKKSRVGETLPNKSSTSGTPCYFIIVIYICTFHN